MALPPRLLTGLEFNKDDEASQPQLRRPVWHYSADTEEAILQDEEVVRPKDKRLKFDVPTEPTTPGARSTDGRDEEESVASGAEEAEKKWPFEHVAQKLEAAIWEITQLRDSMKNPGVALARVERTPLSATELKESLTIGKVKRDQSFVDAESILSTAEDHLSSEIKLQRDYISKLSHIYESWRIVSLSHNPNTSASLRSEDQLAVDLESGLEVPGANLVYIKRDPTSTHGISFSAKDENARNEFRAQSILAEFMESSSPFRVKGQASTLLLGREQQQIETPAAGLPGGIFIPVEQPGESLSSLLEGRFRDAHAKGLMNKLGVKYEIKLNEGAMLRFELVPERKSYEIINEYDAICSLALNLLERGKTAEQIQAVCAQKFAFRRCFDALANVPGAGGITWRHDIDERDQPEKVQSRCCIELGRTGAYAITFVLCKGELSMSWCSLPGYLPKVSHNLTPEQAYQMACEVSVGALVRELVALASKDERMFCDSIKKDSFRIVNKHNRNQAVLSGRVEIENGVIKVTYLIEREESSSYAMEEEERVVCILSEEGDLNAPRNPYYVLRRLLKRK